MKRAFLVAALAMFTLACSGSEAAAPAPPAPAPAPPPPPPPPAVTPVASVTIDNAPGEMETGKSRVLTATPKSEAGSALSGRTVAWASNDDAIASVSSTGAVSAKTPGTATITATSEGKSASVSIKVDTRNGFLTAIVESVRAQYDLPALAGAIVTRQVGMFGSAVSGRRRASQSTPVTLNDLWHIGSNLKAITAHVAGIAVAEGKISWTTTLAEAYPEYAGTMRAEYRNVTLRMLLGHIGGLMANINTIQVPAGTLIAQRANVAMQATALPPVGNGVGTFTYSNVGYMIAANMVERAMGTSWEDIMQQKLLTPLAITSFGWGPTPAATNPIGHQRSGSTWTEWPNSDNAPVLSAAGRSHWSLEAWGKVIQDILKADQGQSPLVTQAVAQVNTTSQSSAQYGSGWYVYANSPWIQGRGVQHDGSNNLNYARAQLGLDAGVAVMAVTNSHDPNSTRSNEAMVSMTQKLWAYYMANSN